MWKSFDVLISLGFGAAQSFVFSTLNHYSVPMSSIDLEKVVSHPACFPFSSTYVNAPEIFINVIGKNPKHTPWRHLLVFICNGEKPPHYHAIIDWMKICPRTLRPNCQLFQFILNFGPFSFFFFFLIGCLILTASIDVILNTAWKSEKEKDFLALQQFIFSFKFCQQLSPL